MNLLTRYISLSIIFLLPLQCFAGDYAGVYRKPPLLDDESGGVEFASARGAQIGFRIYSERRGYSCTTEGFDDNAVAELHGDEAIYKHKDGCSISFKFDDNSVYVIANDACDKWCGAHAYGSLTGMYHRTIAK